MPGELRLSKTALIVDDSKSARFVLKRMLETHALNVATAESAEKALDYLNENRPDVIFMDHMMPGMDGFEAVTAIKNNPDTATIPIMMYTSQKGEVYVGQARALGAVGVLPKEVEPVEVSKVLASLHVIDPGSSVELAAQDVDPVDSTGTFAALGEQDQNIRILIEDLFDQQRAILRRDLLDSYETIATRVAEEIKEPVEDELPAGPSADSNSRLYPVLTGVLTILVLLFGWLYWEREQGWQAVLAQNEELRSALVQQQSLEAQSTIESQQQLDQYAQSLGTVFDTALEAVAWRMNQNSSYGYGVIALGDEKLADFEDLLSQLLGLGFFGQVLVEIHTGDFCLTRTGADTFEPAEDSLPVTQCDAIGFEPGFEIPRQSISFANFMNISQQQSGGQIRFDVVDVGNAEPEFDYPVTESDLTVSSWNEVARRNHRIHIVLNPDT